MRAVLAALLGALLVAPSAAERRESGVSRGAAEWLGPRAPASPGRVVSLAPSLTDVVVALGRSALLVGVTRYDDAPEVRGLPRVGGFLDPSPEAVLAAKPDLAGIVIMLCDQPLLTHETIHRLVEAARTTHRSIAASRYGGAVGVPAFFSADCFSRLCSLSDAEGAKSLIREYAPRTEVIDVPEAALDIDTPEDYARLIDPVLSDPPAGS